MENGTRRKFRYLCSNIKNYGKNKHSQKFKGMLEQVPVGGEGLSLGKVALKTLGGQILEFNQADHIYWMKLLPAHATELK